MCRGGITELVQLDHRTKTQLMEESLQNEDELTAKVGTHLVALIAVTQPISNPKPVPHLDTTSPNPSHEQPQGGNLHSISPPLPFKMPRVSTQTPYQPRPKTITTPEAATILSFFTFLQFSRLHPSDSPLSAQRVDREPIAAQPSAEWRDRLRNRPGSTRPSILSGSKVSERANRAYFYYRCRTRTPHSVSWAEMAP